MCEMSKSPAAVRTALRRERWNIAGPFPFGALELFAAPLTLIPRVLVGARLPDIGRIDPEFVPEDRIR